MWQPTHVKVTVKQAKGILTKGKNGTNDAFVVIGIGKEKYQTSIKEKSSSSVEWREECELAIPSQGNKAMVQLTVYHHNTLGIDEFLGQIGLPLSDFDVYEKPKYRSYRLKGKPDKDKKKGEKDRGELEIMINFTVKSGSFLDISKKEKQKSSLTSLKHLGGSLMSIGGKDKREGLKNFAKSVSSKMDKITKPKRRKSKTPSENSSTGFSNDLMSSQQRYGDADPGVISDDDDDDFKFDDDVKVSTRTSSPLSTMSRGSSLMHDQVLDTVTGSVDNVSMTGSRSSLNTSRESSIHDIKKGDSFTRLPEVKALTLEKMTITAEDDDAKKQKRKQKTGFKNRFFSKPENRDRPNEDSRIVEGGNDRLPSIPSRPSKLPQEIHDKFAGKSREDLLEIILNLQSTLEKQVKHSNELEEYIDNLLLRVMEATPHILQSPITTGPSIKYDAKLLGFF